MKSWIKTHPIKTALLVVVLFFVVRLIYFAGLNYNGYCLKEGRYWSDDEKIKAAFEVINRHGWITADTKLGKSVSVRRVPYKNFEEFIKTNPKCCEVGIGNDDLLKFDARILGHTADVISIEYIEYYLDENNTAQSTSYERQLAIGNCGRILEDDWFAASSN